MSSWGPFRRVKILSYSTHLWPQSLPLTVTATRNMHCILIKMATNSFLMLVFKQPVTCIYSVKIPFWKNLWKLQFTLLFYVLSDHHPHPLPRIPTPVECLQDLTVPTNWWLVLLILRRRSWLIEKFNHFEYLHKMTSWHLRNLEKYALHWHSSLKNI